MRLLAGEHAFDVVTRPGSEGLQVSVDGVAFPAVVEEASPGTFVLRQGQAVETFHCVRAGDEIHLFWRGRVYVLEEETERRRAAHRHPAGALEAPMPGKVIKVNVSVGQPVAKGDEVLVVEAMKMENGLRAPRAGIVKTVSVKVGDMVVPGVSLVEIE
jgi:3-methylcrotonyl-CoA carboxylase alpha subunit